MKDLLIGETFFSGRFHFVETTASGDIAVAWVASDPELHNQAALKYLLDCHAMKAPELAKFCKDTKWSLFQDQPNIVRVFELSYPSKSADHIQALIDLSGHHAEFNGQNPFYDIADIETWIEMLCETLRREHTADKGVPNDPETQVFSSDITPDESDLRLSKALDETVARLTGTQSLFTKAYGSPEQALGAEAEEKQDVYAVGALIYDLLTGRPPFYHGDVLTQIQQTIPDTMSDRRRRFGGKGGLIPQRWEETVAACLSKNPDERPDFEGLIKMLFKEAGPMPVKKTFRLGKIVTTTAAVIILAGLSISGLKSTSVDQPTTLATKTVEAEPTRSIEVKSQKAPKRSLRERFFKPKNTEEKLKPAPIDPTDLMAEEVVDLPTPKVSRPPSLDLGGTPRVARTESERIYASIQATSPEHSAAATVKPIPENSFHLDSIDMEMVWVAPLKIWVAKTEVTQQQLTRGGIKAYSRFKGANLPHDSIKWNSAMEFCQKLTIKVRENGRLPDGFAYTLPTEAQWEAYVGDAKLEHAVYGRGSSKGPEEPGSKPENEFGLVDVRGNLWEWTRDLYKASNPKKGRVLRGGSYATTAAMVMNKRARYSGTEKTAYYLYGFRFVLAPE